MDNSKHFLEKSESTEALNAADVLSSKFEEEIEEREEVGEQPTPESVDELRDRLERMKKMMHDRKMAADIPHRSKNAPEVIDGTFLSCMFAVSLVVILVVSIYAFYNLFWAIWMRKSRYHEEL